MSDKLRQLMGGRYSAQPAPDVPDQDADGTESVSFGRVGAKPLQSVVFRLADGNEWDFEYGHRYAGTFDRGGTYTLTFSGHAVTLEGRNLTKLVEYLRMHRVALVQAADPMHADAGARDACVVTGIVVSELK